MAGVIAEETVAGGTGRQKRSRRETQTQTQPGKERQDAVRRIPEAGSNLPKELGYLEEEGLEVVPVVMGNPAEDAINHPLTAYHTEDMEMSSITAAVRMPGPLLLRGMTFLFLFFAE